MSSTHAAVSAIAPSTSALMFVPSGAAAGAKREMWSKSRCASSVRLEAWSSEASSAPIQATFAPTLRRRSLPEGIDANASSIAGRISPL
jgi:hypothetical protein